MLDLGINSESIGYEVALEVLGQKRQPVMQAMYEERAKANPSKAYIDFCQGILASIDSLQDSLKPSDTETIDNIVSRKGFPL